MLSTAQTTASHLFFLPGALGRTQLWEPVASMLTHPAAIRHIGWPGFSGLPPAPNIHGLDDLVDMVSTQTHACAIAPLIEEFLVKSSQQKSTVV